MRSSPPLLLFAFTMSLAAGLALAPAVILDPDVWWHLRTGEWMLQTGAVPRTDPFSAHGSGAPWLAYTWAFDLILVAVWRLGGETAICWLVAVFCALVAAWAVRAGLRAGHSVTYTGVVATLVIAALTGYATPRPWWASVAGTIAVLEILRQHEKGGGTGRLLILTAVVFGVWANLHIQFVYGLGLVGVWHLLRVVRDGGSIRLAAVGMTTAIGATLVNPYGAGLYVQGLDYARHGVLSRYVVELRPPDLSEPYMVLTALMGCFAAAVLMVRRPQGSLWLGGLVLAAAVAFLRSRRDGWLLVIASAWTLLESPVVRWQAGAALRAVAFAGAVMLFVSGMWRVRPDALAAAVARAFPADAVRHLPASGIVFTPFDWGGYVMWTRPGVSVTLDGRTNVHGVDRTMRLFEVWAGQRPWASEEELRSAAAVIAPQASVLAHQLRVASEWRVLFEDDVAVVFSLRSIAR